MLRALPAFVFSLLLSQMVKAMAPDSLVMYLKNSGLKAPSKDSADFYRVILPPDTTLDRDLYRVYDYYPNGKKKMVATSLTSSINPVLDGTCINYYPNGKRQSAEIFKKGMMTGTVTNYYPNGKLYNILKIDDLDNFYGDNYFNNTFLFNAYRYKAEVVEMRDSTGNLLAKNGTGHVVIFDNNCKQVLEEGEMKNGKRDGEWKGRIADSGEFVCTFHRGELKSGTSYMRSGNRYNFKQLATRPIFSDGGMDAFYLFIKKNLQYPESAKKHKVTGSVGVEFYVEPNGTVSGVKVINGLLKSMDEEAVRVVSLSPLWVPAYRFGIPIRSHMNVSVYFSNY
ncbi:MAG TPA: TonB family protein [Mucilaginibacter sp.]|nr:TonB family protein [Mucilaginibacter sp.]